MSDETNDSDDDYLRHTTPEERERNRNRWEGRVEANQGHTIKTLSKIEGRIETLPAIISAAVSAHVAPLTEKMERLEAIQVTDGARIKTLEVAQTKRTGITEHWAAVWARAGVLGVLGALFFTAFHELITFIKSWLQTHPT